MPNFIKIGPFDFETLYKTNDKIFFIDSVEDKKIIQYSRKLKQREKKYNLVTQLP